VPGRSRSSKAVEADLILCGMLRVRYGKIDGTIDVIMPPRTCQIE
jgi:hypothetical protein